MSNKRTFYVIRVGPNYLHRSHESGAEVGTVTPHLDEAKRFTTQAETVREAARVFSLDDTRDVVAKRIVFELVARHNRRKPKP